MRSSHSSLLAPFCQHSRRAAVYRYHTELATVVLSLVAAEAHSLVFEVPAELLKAGIARCQFSESSLLDALAQQDLFFNEELYLATYPDIAQAVAAGDFVSGYDHYVRFGQFEGRDPVSGFSGGLAEYDTIVVHTSDLSDLERDLGGRFQTHHRVIVVGDDSALRRLPAGATVLAPGLAVFYSPPPAWLGVYTPARGRVEYGRWPHGLAPRVESADRPWPRISIVTPSFNQGHFLEATLRSLIAQQYPNLELIVVDGGSTDSSVEVIRRYEKHLHHWESAKDRGQSHAINKGMQRATGEILTWINSDDRLAPNALFAVADSFRRHAVDLVVGRCARVMDPEIRPYHLHRCALPVGESGPLPLERLLKLDDCWMKGDFFHQPEVFFSRKIWERAGGRLGEDLYFSMDYDLWVRFAAANATILPIPEVLAIFRQHPAQKTGGNDMPFLPELRRVHAEHLSRTR